MAVTKTVETGDSDVVVNGIGDREVVDVLRPQRQESPVGAEPAGNGGAVSGEEIVDRGYIAGGGAIVGNVRPEAGTEEVYDDGLLVGPIRSSSSCSLNIGFALIHGRAQTRRERGGDRGERRLRSGYRGRAMGELWGAAVRAEGRWFVLLIFRGV